MAAPAGAPTSGTACATAFCATLVPNRWAMSPTSHHGGRPLRGDPGDGACPELLGCVRHRLRERHAREVTGLGRVVGGGPAAHREHAEALEPHAKRGEVLTLRPRGPRSSGA